MGPCRMRGAVELKGLTDPVIGMVKQASVSSRRSSLPVREKR